MKLTFFFIKGYTYRNIWFFSPNVLRPNSNKIIKIKDKNTTGVTLIEVGLVFGSVEPELKIAIV